MRTFGKDSPKFMEFKLEGSERVHRLPLSASLRPDFNLRLYEALKAPEEDQEYLTQRFIVDMLGFYLGADFVEAIDSATMIAIWNAWLEESKEASQPAGE